MNFDNNIMDEFRNIDLNKLLTTECPICRDTLYLPTENLYTTHPVQITGCGHKFHKDCLNKWCGRARANVTNCSCPLCRRRFNFNTELIDLTQYILNSVLSLFFHQTDNLMNDIGMSVLGSDKILDRINNNFRADTSNEIVPFRYNGVNYLLNLSTNDIYNINEGDIYEGKYDPNTKNVIFGVRSPNASPPRSPNISPPRSPNTSPPRPHVIGPPRTPDTSPPRPVIGPPRSPDTSPPRRGGKNITQKRKYKQNRRTKSTR